jgi:hypothetical protein
MHGLMREGRREPVLYSTHRFFYNVSRANLLFYLSVDRVGESYGSNGGRARREDYVLPDATRAALIGCSGCCLLPSFHPLLASERGHICLVPTQRGGREEQLVTLAAQAAFR